MNRLDDLKDKDGLILGKHPEYWEGIEEGRLHSTSSPETRRTFDKIDQKLDEHSEVHKEILTQMEKGFDRITARQDIANGRVKTNEIKIAYATGGISVMGIIAVPILAWALFTLVGLEKAIDTSVVTHLQAVELIQ